MGTPGTTWVPCLATTAGAFRDRGALEFDNHHAALGRLFCRLWWTRAGTGQRQIETWLFVVATSLTLLFLSSSNLLDNKRGKHGAASFGP